MPDAARRLQPFAVLLSCLALAACVTPRPSELETEPAPPPRYHHHHPAPAASESQPPQAYAPTEGGERVTDLPGWREENHAAAFRAFQAGCRVTRNADLYQLCHEARSLGALGEDDARDFFEINFRVRVVEGQGLLTGYFVPEYEARETEGGAFSAPVRPKPLDLAAAGGVYADRAAIEAEPTTDALAWMRPEDLFFMQVQGSGVLDFPDGHRMKASFAASNGQPFTPIAAPLRDRGALTNATSTGGAVRAWLTDHRGPEADAVMQLDRRYVFFTLTPDDGLQAVGTAGLPLPPGRAIAVDQTQHALGGLYWIDADSPTLSGAAADYRRLVVALDTGGAIKGAVRADLFIGRGDAAGVEAGHVRHVLRLYELTPADESNR